LGKVQLIGDFHATVSLKRNLVVERFMPVLDLWRQHLRQEVDYD
jgi:hypothetical protein